VAIDLPRAGDLDQLLELLKQVIHVGTTHPFHLLASSATGWIAQYLAHEFEDQVLSLILINSFHSNRGYGTKYRMALKSTKLLPAFKFKKEILEKADILKKGIDDKCYETYLEQRIDALGKSGIREQISWFLDNRSDPKPLEIPVLSIHPKHDPLISRQEYRSLQRYHKNLKSVEIKSDDHLLFLRHPSQIGEEVIQFLNS
jgi:pimeloyl-ACP methyl ester carboxylesterase